MASRLGDIVAELAIDKKKWESGLSGGAADLRKFGGDVNRTLSAASREVERLATAYVTGGKVTKDELDKAVAAEKRWQQTLAARKALLDNLRGTTGDLAEVGPSAASLRVRRTEEEQLKRIRTLLSDLADEEAKTGRSREGHMQRLLRLEANLAASIERRTTLVDRNRAAYVAEGIAAEQAAHAAMAAQFGRVGMTDFNSGARGRGRGPIIGSQGGGRGRGGQSLALGALEGARGLEDAAVGYELNGVQGAVRGSLNNVTALMMILGGPLTAAVGGVAAVLGSILIPRLFEAGGAFESVAEKAKRVKEESDKAYETAKATGRASAGLIGADQTLAEGRGLRERREEAAAFARRLFGTEEQATGAAGELRDRIKGRRGELSDIDYGIASAKRGIDAAIESDNEDLYQRELANLADLMKKREAVLGPLAEDEKQLAIAQRRLKEMATRRAEIDQAASYEQQEILMDRRNQRRLENSGELDRRARAAAVATFREGRDRELLSGMVDRRLGALRTQRANLWRSDRSFERPEAVEREQSMDRILDVIAGRGKSQQDAERKKREEQLDKQIKLLEDIKAKIAGPTPIKKSGIS